jgi:hypothetical protein
MLRDATKGRLGGRAVFQYTLNEAEMRRLNEEANLV